MAAGSLTVIAWFAWPRDPELPLANTERASTPAAAAQPPVRAAAPGASREATPLAPSEPATPTASTTADAATESFAFEFTTFERDAWSLPIHASSPWFAPTNAPPLVYYSEGFVDEGNELRFRWRGPRATGELVFGCGLLRRIALRADQPLRIANGEHLAPPSRAIASGALKDAELDPAGVVTPVFGPRIAPMAAFLALDDSATGGHFGIAPTAPRAKAPRRGTLVGNVLTHTGQVPREFVVRRSGSRVPAKTNVDGTFAFAPMDVGSYEIEAGARDGSSARASVRVGEGTANITLQLVGGAAVRGRVVDPSGAPVANARLVWWTDDGDYDNRAVTRADGTFVVPTNTTRSGSLWACVPGDGARWPVVGDDVQADTNDVALVLTPATCKGTMHVTVTSGTLTARLWQQTSGLGMELVRLRRDEASSDFAAIDLPAGNYTLELCSHLFGVVDGGTFWCDGRTDVALPRIELPPPCKITIALPDGTPEPSAFEFVRTGCDFPSRIHTTLGIAATHLLGPGDYELWWRHGANEPPGSLAFTIARDQRELTLRLP